MIVKYILSRRTIVWSLKGIFNCILYWSLNKYSNARILFYCHDVHRYVRKNSKFYSPLIDVVHEEIGMDSGVSCFAPFSKLTSRECYIESKNYNLPILAALIMRLVYSGQLTLKNVKKDPVINAYIKIFNRIGCRFVLAIQPSIEMCVAAKRLNINIYDLQHGVIGGNGYYSLEKRRAFGQQGWPNAVLCWDMVSANAVDRFTSGLIRGIVVGHPAYATRVGRTLLSDFQSIAPVDISIRFTILVTLTWHDYGNTYEDEAYKVLGIPAELLELMRRATNVSFRIRLHPVQWLYSRARVTSFLKDTFSGYTNVNFIDYNECYIGAALYNCGGHITVGSAATIEAWQLRIRTLLVEGYPPLEADKINKYFADYISAGAATIISRSQINALTEDELISHYNLKENISGHATEFNSREFIPINNVLS
jgi:hypothetical protein